VTTPIRTPDPQLDRTDGWHHAARRVRVLSLLQVGTIAAIALLVLAASIVTGRELLHAEAERSRLTTAQLAVIDAREDFRALENDAWFAASDRDRPPAAMPAGWMLRAVSVGARFTALADDARTVSPGAAAAAATALERLGDVERASRFPVDATSERQRAAVTELREVNAEFNRAVDDWVGAYGRRLADVEAGTGSFMSGVLTLFAGGAALLCLFGAGVWFALNRARNRVVAGMEQTVAEQAALRRTATEIATLPDTRAIMDAMAREVAELFGGDRASVVRFDTGGAARIAGSSATGGWEGPVHLTGMDAVSEVSRTEGPAVVADHLLLDDDACRRLATIGIRSAVAAPIRVDGCLWGALVAGSGRPGAFDDTDAERLERFCDLASLAVSNAEKLTRLADQAASDPLTGLANHRAFRERLAVEAERARRHGRELALAVFDIDRFKLVNEALGHQGGDSVLVDLGERLRAACRDGDLVARVGGEEFAWLMPETDSWGAWCAAERIRVEVAGAPLSGLGQQTVSAGVCDLAQAGGDGDRLYELADGSVYWAKAHGRDLCVRYSPDVVVDLSASERAARLEQRRTLDAVRLLAQAVDARDENTQRHSERVAALCAELADALGWTPDRIELLREAALVHDVGKIGVPDSVLLKEGPLSPGERDRIQAHAALGAQMVADVLSTEQVAWVRGHHERWDGHGYPDGLAGEQISDGAQVLIVADAFDAMSADRPYRRGLPLDAAYQEVVDGRGTQFPPAVVEAMTTLMRSGRLAAILEAAATAAGPDDDAAGTAT